LDSLVNKTGCLEHQRALD
ncbi:hypothetical protein GWI33_001588, partial [Rhynchophorus ferrugineus]